MPMISRDEAQRRVDATPMIRAEARRLLLQYEVWSYVEPDEAWSRANNTINQISRMKEFRHIPMRQIRLIVADVTQAILDDHNFIDIRFG